MTDRATCRARDHPQARRPNTLPADLYLYHIMMIPPPTGKNTEKVSNRAHCECLWRIGHPRTHYLKSCERSRLCGRVNQTNNTDDTGHAGRGTGQDKYGTCHGAARQV
eukprot:2867110-Rhodomonas_salina.1